MDNDGDASFRLPTYCVFPILCPLSGPVPAWGGGGARQSHPSEPVDYRPAARMRALGDLSTLFWVLESSTLPARWARRTEGSCLAAGTQSQPGDGGLMNLFRFHRRSSHDTETLGSASRASAVRRDADRRRGIPTATFCALSSMFLFLFPLIAPPLNQRLRLSAAVLGSSDSSKGELSCPLQATSAGWTVDGNCLTAMLDRMQGVMKPAMAVDRDPMRALLPALGP